MSLHLTTLPQIDENSKEDLTENEWEFKIPVNHSSNILNESQHYQDYPRYKNQENTEPLFEHNEKRKPISLTLKETFIKDEAHTDYSSCSQQNRNITCSSSNISEFNYCIKEKGIVLQFYPVEGQQEFSLSRLTDSEASLKCQTKITTRSHHTLYCPQQNMYALKVDSNRFSWSKQDEKFNSLDENRSSCFEITNAHFDPSTLDKEEYQNPSSKPKIVISVPDIYSEYEFRNNAKFSPAIYDKQFQTLEELNLINQLQVFNDSDQSLLTYFGKEYKETYIEAMRKSYFVMSQYQSTTFGEEEEEESEGDSQSDSEKEPYTYKRKFIDSGLRPLRSQESKLYLDLSRHRNKLSTSSDTFDDIPPLLEDIPSEIYDKPKKRKKKKRDQDKKPSVTSVLLNKNTDPSIKWPEDYTYSGPENFEKATSVTSVLPNFDTTPLVKLPEDDYTSSNENFGSTSATSMVPRNMDTVPLIKLPENKGDYISTPSLLPNIEPVPRVKFQEDVENRKIDDFCLHTKDPPFSSSSSISLKGSVSYRQKKPRSIFILYQDDDFCIHTYDLPEEKFSSAEASRESLVSSHVKSKSPRSEESVISKKSSAPLGKTSRAPELSKPGIIDSTINETADSLPKSFKSKTRLSLFSSNILRALFPSKRKRRSKSECFSDDNGEKSLPSSAKNGSVKSTRSTSRILPILNKMRKQKTK